MKSLYLCSGLSFYCWLICSVLSFKYKAIPQDPGNGSVILHPCPGREHEVFKTFFNTDNLTMIFIDDENVEYNGYIFVVVDLKGKRIRGDVRAERKLYGRWIPIPFKLRYFDFCASLYDSKQMHYQYVKHWPKVLGTKECPYYKMGLHLPLDHVRVNLIIDGYPDSNAEGQYRVFFDFAAGNLKVCGIYYGDLVRY